VRFNAQCDKNKKEFSCLSPQYQVRCKRIPFRIHTLCTVIEVVKFK
jgi:hypothetical protein